MEEIYKQKSGEPKNKSTKPKYNKPSSSHGANSSDFLSSVFGNSSGKVLLSTAVLQMLKMLKILQTKKKEDKYGLESLKNKYVLQKNINIVMRKICYYFFI